MPIKKCLMIGSKSGSRIAGWLGRIGVRRLQQPLHRSGKEINLSDVSTRPTRRSFSSQSRFSPAWTARTSASVAVPGGGRIRMRCGAMSPSDSSRSATVSTVVGARVARLIESFPRFSGPAAHERLDRSTTRLYSTYPRDAHLKARRCSQCEPCGNGAASTPRPRFIVIAARPAYHRSGQGAPDLLLFFSDVWNA
jgi:hypothetical protein